MNTNTFTLDHSMAQQPFRSFVAMIRKENPLFHHVYPVLLLDWPEAIELLQRADLLVSQSILINGRPCIREIIENVVLEYGDQLQAKSFSYRNDVYRMALITNLVLDGLVRLGNIAVSDATGKVWSLASVHGMNDFARSAIAPLSLEESPTTAGEGLRQHLYDMLIEGNIKEIMQDFDYEKAVVAGSLDTGS